MEQKSPLHRCLLVLVFLCSLESSSSLSQSGSSEVFWPRDTVPLKTSGSHPRGTSPWTPPWVQTQPKSTKLIFLSNPSLQGSSSPEQDLEMLQLYQWRQDQQVRLPNWSEQDTLQGPGWNIWRLKKDKQWHQVVLFQITGHLTTLWRCIDPFFFFGLFEAGSEREV